MAFDFCLRPWVEAISVFTLAAYRPSRTANAFREIKSAAANVQRDSAKVTYAETYPKMGGIRDISYQSNRASLGSQDVLDRHADCAGGPNAAATASDVLSVTNDKALFHAIFIR